MTTVLGALENSALDEWRERVGEHEAELISRRATHKGTGVHELCEKYLKNELTSFDGYDIIQSEGFLKLKPILDAKVNNIRTQESVLFSHRLQMAGRVDLIAEYGNVLSIIDFKTSNKPKEKDWIHKYFIQETGYACMIYEMLGIKISQLVTIITVEDDEPQIFIENPENWMSKLIEIRNLFKQKWSV